MAQKHLLRPLGPWWWKRGQRACLPSNDPTSNPTEAFCFFCNIKFEKNENKQKEVGLAQFFLTKDSQCMQKL